MKTKIQNKYKYRNKSKFCLHRVLIQDKPKTGGEDKSCHFCDGVVEDKARMNILLSGIGVICHNNSCNKCGLIWSGTSKLDNNVRALSKIRVSLKKRSLPKNEKRKTRRCKFTIEQWIRRCDRIDNGWYFGDIQAHFKR